MILYSQVNLLLQKSFYLKRSIYLFIHYKQQQQMQIEHSNSGTTILQFSNKSSNNEQQKNLYFTKHWQVIQTSIKFFIINKAAINLVALQKSLQLLTLYNKSRQLRDSLQTLWRQIFTQLIRLIEDNGEANPLISLIENYKMIQQRLKIVFTLLKSYLRNNSNSNNEQYVKRVDGIDMFGKVVISSIITVQDQAFEVLCQLILSSSKRDIYQRQLMLLITAYRNSSYSQQTIISPQNCKQQLLIDLLIIKKIGLFRYLQSQFDSTSREFYVQLAGQLPKDKRFLFIVNQYLERQIELNRMFQPQVNTVYYVEKQLVKEYYPFVLEELLEQMVEMEDVQGLKILWRFTLRLKDTAMRAFESRLKSIIKSSKRYILTSTQSPSQVFKLINFQQTLYSLTQRCFEKNRKICNLIYNTFQQVLYQQQKNYLNIALKNILVEFSDYNDNTFKNNNNNKMMIIQEQRQQQDLIQSVINSSCQSNRYFKLFRMAPSKQNFIREFQMRFSKWILAKGFQLHTLKLQSHLIYQMRKQVGNNLMKRLDKMLTDVYRNDKMHYIQQLMSTTGTRMKCMFLSTHWPIDISIVFNISDQLYNMQSEFQDEFKRTIENKEKSVKWLSQMGTLVISINSVESVVSQIQATIILLLDKSIRPLKKEQIQASLEIRNISHQHQGGRFDSLTYLEGILEKLVKNNILNFNPGPQTYDINDDNKIPYKFQRTGQDGETQAVKRVDMERDNSILIEAAIMKILKRRKNLQRSDITRFIQQTVKNFKPTFEQITKALQKLHNSQDIEINREKGIITYLQ